MIRRSFALFAAVSLVTLAQVTPVAAQESRPSGEFEDESERYSEQQLDNLVGAVALYPDALLAQVLVAATFPEQLEEAARFVRANGTDDVDDQNWDVSVKAVAHYPSALNMMGDKIDWTAALGRAYAVQSSDVMAAVQRMRAMADSQGNLQSSDQQTVIRDEGNYVIAPTQTRVIYVPVYDPYMVYTRPIFRSGLRTSFWSFGVGFPIGAWLTYDFNWSRRNVYYNGWDRSYYGYAGGWRQRSRPFISVTNIYVNPRYRNVYINRDITRRRVVYQNVDRYPGVHRDARFSRGPVIWRGSQRSVGYDRGYDRSNDRDYGRSNDRDYSRSNDRDYSRSNDRDYGRSSDRRPDRTYDRSPDRNRTYGIDRRDDRSRSVVVPQGQGGSIGRPYDGSRDRSSSDRGDDRSRSVVVPQGQGGSIGRPYDGSRDRNDSRGSERGGFGGRRPESSPGASEPTRQRDRGQRDDSRGRGNGGGFGGTPSGMTRAPERNDAPMINPRRAERVESGPLGGGRGNGGGRGGRGGREMP